jgi:hypothetical protein
MGERFDAVGVAGPEGEHDGGAGGRYK